METNTASTDTPTITDLFLRFQFIDRAGRHVYNIYSVIPGPAGVPDNGCYSVKENIIGQIRMHPDANDQIELEWIKDEGSQ